MRNYNDFIKALVNVDKENKIPLTYRTWSALSVVAGALGRKVFYNQGHFVVSPHLYIILLGPPAAGKSLSYQVGYNRIAKALSIDLELISNEDAREIAKESYSQYLDPSTQPIIIKKDRITVEKLAVCMARLSKASVRADSGFHFNPVASLLEPDGSPLMDNSINLLTSEFATFIRKREETTSAFMIEMWDRKPDHAESTKTGGTFYIRSPSINWIACATPASFIQNLQEGARGQGFLSRMIIVLYKGRPMEPELEGTPLNTQEAKWLIEDLAQIRMMKGEYKWDNPALKERVSRWVKGGMYPTQPEPNMTEYNSRRLSHFLKILMCFAASRRDQLIFKEEDYEDAKALLIDTEERMPAVLNLFGMSDSGKVLFDIMDYVKQYISNNDFSSIPGQTLKMEIMRRAKSVMECETIIKRLLDVGLIEEIHNDVYALGAMA